MVIVKNPESCTGCLICVMACSFHHIREYSRSHSSIKVSKSIFDRERGAEIEINSDDSGPVRICDLCKGEGSLLCIRFCPENVFEIERDEK
jgi:Fe-S-cluster-containing hydrogenase component 2